MSQEPMVCFNCGLPISGLWDAYQEMLKDHKKGDPLLPIFEQLNINCIGCRTIFTTSVNFFEMRAGKQLS